jgi:hypothetical protein
MKKANCIWILAPIMRAVDSKIAKDLLGDAFRNQLMSAYKSTCHEKQPELTETQWTEGMALPRQTIYQF